MNIKWFMLGLLLGAMLVLGTAKADDHQFWAEVGAGYNTSFFQSTERYQWENAGSPAFFGRLSYEYYPIDRIAFVVQYAHVSQWMAGPPFNDKGESSLDHFGISVRWRLDK